MSVVMGKCDTCGIEGELFVYALPGIPMTVANCRVCFETGCYPWFVLVSNTAQIGGMEQAADWWKGAVNTTLARLGKTQEEFLSAVVELEGLMDPLVGRQARFVYEAARLAAQAAGAPVIPAPFDMREQAFRDQFFTVIARQMSEQRSRSPEELHGSWMQSYLDMGWEYGEKYDPEKKTHPDLVPYADLGQLERDKDAVFVALCEIARQWIY